MTHRERVKNILSKKPVDRTAFWLGEPRPETLAAYCQALNVPDRWELAKKLDEDIIWIMCDQYYESRNGKPMFDIMGGKPKVSLSQPGVFADCESVEEIEAYNWSDPSSLNFERIEQALDKAEEYDLAVFGGMWSCFFHVVSDFFGMENYMVKMYTEPEVVEALTQKVVDFYYTANQLIFERFASKFTAAFMGNDFGTQISLLVGPEQFRQFILPHYKRLIDLAHSYGLPVVVHSCGSIIKLIPDLIQAGIDGLHPLQALASGMDAENLQNNFGGQIAFMGGVDTQQLLPNGTDEEIKNEVKRLKRVFSENYIVSPSHEGLQMDIPLRAVLAMADEAVKG